VIRYDLYLLTGLPPRTARAGKTNKNQVANIPMLAVFFLLDTFLTAALPKSQHISVTNPLKPEAKVASILSRSVTFRARLAHVDWIT